MRLTTRGTVPVKKRVIFEDLRDSCQAMLDAKNYAESYMATIQYVRNLSRAYAYLKSGPNDISR